MAVLPATMHHYRDDPPFPTRSMERMRLRLTIGITRHRGREDKDGAELARRIGKNPASVRRLFSAEGNPELKTIAAMAAALDAEIKIVPRVVA